MAKKKKKQTKKAENITYRPPIVTLMGHVDHGKTSLLDAIRETNITKDESGGITQHTGAYNVEKDDKKITFIDTPGHEAFTQMRARGGKAADIVILVVAADDGVMPQTKEAIMHAKAANVPIIIAINKCDLEGAKPDKVKRELSQENILVEGYGGEVVTVEVSAIAKTGIDELLDVITLTAEMTQDALKTDANGKLEALIIESRKDSKKGSIVSVIIKNGTMKIRDELIAKTIEGRVKVLTDSYGERLKEAIPGDAVEILGFTDLPVIGDVITRKGEATVKKEETESAQADETAQTDKTTDKDSKTDSEAATEETAKTPKKILNIVIRTDTAGTQEAIVSSIKKIKVEDAEPNILFAGTGEVKESDILLASSAKAVVMAFKVNIPKSIFDLAKTQKVIVRNHDIIYRMLEEIEGALEGVLEIEEAKIRGRGILIQKFTLPKSGMLIAGTLVEAGKFKQNDRIGIYRSDKDTPLYVSRIRSLHVGTKEVDKAIKGEEVGILLKPPIEDLELDDVVEVL